MKFFSKKHQEEAICPSCGEWKTTDFTPEELQEKEWECSDCANKRLSNPADLPENRGSQEVSKYSPEYLFLIKLVKLLSEEGVPPQELKAIAQSNPFTTIDDVGNLAAKFWTLATEKYKIPREWLISKLPKNASLKTANDTYDDEWQAQKETEDILDHAPGYLAYDYGQDKTADGEFKGSEFSGTDAAPNPLTDIGPWSSPEDHGKKPQKSPFPNTNWLPADDQNLDQQAPSNVAASLKKEAVNQQDVVDFYLLSLLPPQYLNKEVSPDHYDALTIFKGIIESLRNEYIERGMEELVDEAETTAWTKAIPDVDMPEEIKKYYTFHDGAFPGRNYSGDPDNGDNFDYSCASCGNGLSEDDVYFFKDEQYCESCEFEAIMNKMKEEVAYCKTHNVFLTDDRELVEYLGGKKVGDWDKHHDNGVCEVVRYDAGQKIWKEVEENAKNQLHLQFEERKKRREQQQPEQLKLRPGEQEDNEYPFPGPSPTASLKQAGGRRYLGNDEGWWEAPDYFGGYTAQDFYTIFEYAPWKSMYGGPAWAEIAKTIYQMQQTTDWQKLVVLIDHFHDLGHNTGKLLDKFPEWHQWFKKLLDQKAKKNSLRYLLPRASKPVQNLVTDFLKVHGRDWRADENKDTPKKKLGPWEVGDEVLVKNESKDPKHKRHHSATIIEINPNSEYSYTVQYENGATDNVMAEMIESPQFNVSSLNRPFSKKANPNSRLWIAPDGTEFPVSGNHGLWIKNNPKILKKYGIVNNSIDLSDTFFEMYNTGWVRVSNEPAGTGFQIQVSDTSNIPSTVDGIVARYFTQGETILIGDGYDKGFEITDPFPTMQKAVNKIRKPVNGSLKEAAISGRVTNKILQSIHDNGGVTYNLTQGDMSGTPNYSVSIYPDRERIVDGVDFDILEGFMSDNEDLLQDPNNSIGSWSNDGKVYLDIVITTPDQEKAIDLAKQNNQIAIWDLQHGREISTGGSGGGMMPKAFSKQNLIKTAEESLLPQNDQNAIAAASSPAYVIAVNNYAEALKRGHSKDRSLEYAIDSVQNLEKVDPKKLVEFINTYVPN